MSGVELATLPTGVLWYQTSVGGPLAAAAGATAYIYQHVVPPATPSVQFQIYQDEGLTIPISQPLTARSDGSLPGYIDAPAGGDIGQIFDVVPTFNDVTLDPQMGNALRGDTAMGSSGPITITQQSGNYDLASGDLFTRVESTGSSAQTFTIPSGLGVAGDVIELGQMGTGKLTVAAAGGVTLNAPGGLVSAGAQYATLGLICEGSDDWTLSGYLGS